MPSSLIDKRAVTQTRGTQATAQTRTKYEADLLDGRVLEIISANLRYLPDWSVIQYNGQNTDTTPYNVSPPRNDVTKNSATTVTGRFFIGGNGADTVGSEGASILLGGAGNDDLGRMTKTGALLGSLLWGGVGADTFHVYVSNVDNNNIIDLAKDDRVIFHFDGGNALSSNEFKAQVANYAFLYSETTRLTFEVTANGPSFTGSAYSDVITLGGSSTFVNAVDAKEGDDTIIGTARAEDLRGGSGNDFIDGGGGKDTLRGGEGADTICFYAGDSLGTADRLDTIIVKSAGVSIGSEYGTIVFDLSSTTERTTLNGGNFNDTLAGYAAQQSINGGGGADSILIFGNNASVNGGAGDDTLIQYGMNAILFGGAGTDIFFVSNDTFTIRDLTPGELIIAMGYSAQLHSKLITLQNQGAIVTYEIELSAQATSIKLAGLNGNDVVTGTAFADSIQGLAGNDSLIGGSGNDTLNGGTGDDTLIGGLGSDSLLGGDGNDWLEGNAGADTLSGENGNDTLVGSFAGDLLSGGDGNDLLMGLDGSDRINGDAGNDTLVGGMGNDTLTGGDGRDVFVFNPTNENYSATITDFTSGQDKIDLSGFTLAGMRIAAITNAVQYNATSRLITADIYGDGFLDVNVQLQAGARFNKATDLIVTNLT